VFAQDPGEGVFIDKAKQLFSEKKYHAAAAVLKDAGEKYPESLKIAKLTINVYETAQLDEKYIAEACKRTIKLYSKKKGAGELDWDQKQFLDKTEKKLEKLMKFRGPVDAAVGRFIEQGTTTFNSLVNGKHYPEACFVYHRLLGAGMDAEARKKLIAKLGAEKADLIKRPAYYEDDLCVISKILKKARRALKKNKLDLVRE
jgi:hypothetical protein